MTQQPTYTTTCMENGRLIITAEGSKSSYLSANLKEFKDQKLRHFFLLYYDRTNVIVVVYYHTQEMYF